MQAGQFGGIVMDVWIAEVQLLDDFLSPTKILHGRRLVVLARLKVRHASQRKSEIALVVHVVGLGLQEPREALHRGKKVRLGDGSVSQLAADQGNLVITHSYISLQPLF